MKRTRTLLVALIAWMLCFQAVASVSDVRCQHVGQTGPKQHMMNGRVMTMAAMIAEPRAMHEGHRAGMGMASAPVATKTTTDKASTAPICDCGSGCACSGQCTVSCSGIGDNRSVVFAFLHSLPAVIPALAAIAAAHGLDLFRPPSIS